MATLKLPVLVVLLAVCLVHATDSIDHISQLIKERQARSTRSVQIPKPTPTRHFEHYVRLDTTGQFWLFWTANATHVTFETHVNTHGYIGFGISPNGKMFPADVIVGGVKDGQTYFKDYHTTEHAPPVVDQSQDWFLIAGKETASGTVLTFVRKLNTCDTVGDMVITDDTTRIIYAYNPDDVTSFIPYHGATRRGTKSVMLLSSSLTAEDVNFPQDIVTYDLVHNNHHVPSNTTAYSCRAMKLPPLTSKHHMIKYEPVITQGNELNVHHAVVYRCDKRAAELDKYDGTVFPCENTNTAPEPLRGCLYKAIIAWAIGGEAFYFPPSAGYSLGTDADPDFLVMQTHYDNPLGRSDIVDSSGFRITITPTLRLHDSALLTIGIGVTPMQIIPPLELDFVSQGYCPAELLGKGLPQEGINAFAILQHSHLLGKEIMTRLYRNGSELEPLAVDRHYDFDYQDMRYLSRERKIYPDDKIEVKCVYDSSNRQGLTLGGFSTHEEMCEAFIMYYPRTPLDICQSVPLYNTIADNAQKVFPVIKTWNWTDPAVRANFRSALDHSVHYHYAMGSTDAVNAHTTTTEPPTKHPYVKPPDTRCQH
ncbi:DBH-like monooxygenase protein 1 [Mizuhopecten yessoensis]|uniref:DBH-like monooxygenase protein 1 n=1 Tax=Mizuhopecten yessoensis TaxID=6573 RepID=A0A210PUK3_MIZYE|nr:DBH-like monooxygenase protein 1 [Mizuhopecten yessoensis]